MPPTDNCTDLLRSTMSAAISAGRELIITSGLYLSWKFNHVEGVTPEERRLEVENWASSNNMPATIDASCYGCIVVIMNCPQWAWQRLTALKQPILAQFGTDLRSITQLDCTDVTELIQRQDNVQFRPALQQLQTKMVLNQVPNIIEHKYVLKS